MITLGGERANTVVLFTDDFAKESCKGNTWILQTNVGTFCTKWRNFDQLWNKHENLELNNSQSPFFVIEVCSEEC